jgi:hypothetical protein
MGHSRSCRCERCQYRYQRREFYEDGHCSRCTEHRRCKYCSPKKVIINNCGPPVVYGPRPVVYNGYNNYGYNNYGYNSYGIGPVIMPDIQIYGGKI